MLLAKLFPDEQYDKKPRHDTDSRATLGAGVHRIYLPTPLDAHSVRRGERMEVSETYGPARARTEGCRRPLVHVRAKQRPAS